MENGETCDSSSKNLMTIRSKVDSRPIHPYDVKLQDVLKHLDEQFFDLAKSKNKEPVILPITDTFTRQKMENDDTCVLPSKMQDVRADKLAEGSGTTEDLQARTDDGEVYEIPSRGEMKPLNLMTIRSKVDSRPIHASEFYDKLKVLLIFDPPKSKDKEILNIGNDIKIHPLLLPEFKQSYVLRTVIEEMQPLGSADSVAKDEEHVEVPLGMETGGAVWAEQDGVGQSIDTGIKTHSGPDKVLDLIEEIQRLGFANIVASDEEHIMKPLTIEAGRAVGIEREEVRRSAEAGIRANGGPDNAATQSQYINLQPAELYLPSDEDVNIKSEKVKAQHDVKGFEALAIKLCKANFGLKMTGLTRLDDESYSGSNLLKNYRRNFDKVKVILKRLCDEIGAKNVTIFNVNPLKEYTLIGENTASLEAKIKEVECLKQFKIIVKERKGATGFLVKTTVFHPIDSYARSEFILHNPEKNYCIAILPAHTFLDFKYLNKEDEISSMENNTFKIKFEYSEKDFIATEGAPKILFYHLVVPDLQVNVTYDIAAVEVNWRLFFKSYGQVFNRPRILRVSEEVLDLLQVFGVAIFIKERNVKGYICKNETLSDQKPCEKGEDGLLWIDFKTRVLERGDSGTIMYVKDRNETEYMLSMLSVGYEQSDITIYGTTVLSYNLEILCRKFNDARFTQVCEEILETCDEDLLTSLISVSECNNNTT